MITFGSLFAGIGGIDLGLERAGMTCAWQVEIDPFCRQVLAKHWPDVPRHSDIKEVQGDDLEPVDLVAGGFPCQPISRAGARKVTTDDRWLWPHFARIVRLVRPKFVLVENVPELLDPWRDRDTGTWNPAPVEDILADLETCGYHAEWDCLPAAAFGAPHLRDRVFVVAHADSQQLRDESVSECWCERSSVFADNGSSWSRTDAYSHEREAKDQQAQQIGELRPEPTGMGVHPDGYGGWLSEPPVFSLDDGVPYRLVRDRLKALGNAVVPQVAEWLGKRILTSMSDLQKV